MALPRFDRRQAPEPLADALLAVASSLPHAVDDDDALNRVAQGLSDRGLTYALLLSGEDTTFSLERATLPFAPEVWGRPLRLTQLVITLSAGRPAFYPRADDVLSDGLLSERPAGPLIVAPLRARGRGAVLCLSSPELRDGDRGPAWALALQLGAALGDGASPAPATDETPGGDLSLFHELTRRLSHSLSGDEVVRTGLEVLAPALGFQLAASVVCRGDEDATSVYLPRDAPAVDVSHSADEALDAFAKLTGAQHRSCARPPFQTFELATAAPASAGDRTNAVTDAPLVTEGNVIGLLRIAGPAALDPTKERAFYTVANQISLALERAAAQRKAERAHLASLAESLSDGIVLVDADLRVTSLNDPAHDHLGALDVSIAAGDTLVEASLVELAREALSSQRPTALRELPGGTSASGPARRFVVAMAAPLAGSPEGSAAVVILRDVTEERLMQERLLQSEKMVSVGQLVSGVAHELNNPLTGITGFAQLLLARELDEQTKRDVETIYHEAERAGKIVQNLLSFARRKKTEQELVNLNVLVERVLELRTYDLRVKNIEVELDLDPALPETMVDANQVQQVFLNVVINAEQAMLAAHGRGTLTVRSRREGEMIRVAFQDDGPGMEPETLRRIFDPFYTTKAVGDGTGLGLTISYGIVDEHGGRIWAESRPGRGTTFFVELPVVQRAGGPAARPETEPEPAVTGRSILVVDDEESIQRLLGSILEIDGHRVDTARNGREALERIGRRRYDVIITDIKMPDMDGRELYGWLRERDRSLSERTIFITGDTVSPETRTFLQRVDNPCLAKPFRVREVRETIAQVLGEA